MEYIYNLIMKNIFTNSERSSSGLTLHFSPNYKVHGSPCRGHAYFPKHDIIATSSWDKTIKIIDASRMKEIETIGHHTHFVFHLIKFNEDVFISGGWDGIVGCFSAKKNTGRGKRFIKKLPPGPFLNRTVYRLTKLNDDLILITGRSEQFITSYSKNEIIYTLKGYTFHELVKPVVSKCFENSYYFNTENGQIFLNQYLPHSKILSNFVPTQDPYALATFIQKKYSNNNEYVVCGGSDFKIEIINPKGEIIITFKSDNYKKSDVYSIFIYSNYIFWSNQGGNLSICEIDFRKLSCLNSSQKIKTEEEHNSNNNNNNNIITLLEEKKVFGRVLNEITLAKKITPEKLLLLVSSDEGSIRTLTISGLKNTLDNDLEEKDLLGRIEFVTSPSSSSQFFTFDQKDLLKIFVTLKLRNKKLENILRITILM